MHSLWEILCDEDVWSFHSSHFTQHSKFVLTWKTFGSKKSLFAWEERQITSCVCALHLYLEVIQMQFLSNFLTISSPCHICRFLNAVNNDLILYWLAFKMIDFVCCDDVTCLNHFHLRRLVFKLWTSFFKLLFSYLNNYNLHR